MLSECEIWKLEQLAHWRSDPKAHLPRPVWGGQDSYDSHLRGVKAEYAVSIYFREPMDLFIDLGGDHNVTDLVIANFTVQVKCPNYTPPFLKFNSLEEFHQDVAVLTSLDAPDIVRLHGWTTPDRFKRLHHRQDFSYGERVVCTVKDLHRMVLLKAIAYDRWKDCQLRGRLGHREQGVKNNDGKANTA